MASRITRWVSLKCRHILSLCHPISTHAYTGILILTGIGMSNQPASHVRPFRSANRPKAALLKWLCFILLTRWVFCLNRGSSVNCVYLYFCQNLQRWWNWQKKSIFLLVIHEQPLLQLKGYSGNFSVRGTAVLSSNVANRATWCHEMGQVWDITSRIS